MRKAIVMGEAIVTIDWRYRILVFFWRLIPRRLWIRLRITTKKSTLVPKDVVVKGYIMDSTTGKLTPIE